MSEDALLRVHLSAGYSEKATLSEIRFELQQGEILGLVGSSGAGKSTLVLSLLGLLPWRGGRVSGEVLLRDCDLLKLSEKHLRSLRGREVALIPQSPMTALNAAVSLRSHFEEAWKAHKKHSRAALDERVRELMAEVHLPADAEFLRRRPREISVGQAQRILIALALLHRPALIVADEPTSALDPVTQSQIIDLLRNLNRRHGVTLLYISHDLISVIQLCDRVAVLHEGTIVENLPVGQLEEARHAASLALLRALPVPPRTLLRFRDNAMADELPQTLDYSER
ncbi:MAG TPA: ATP-binding cassette domain-containing protein [Acidobacteriaceae bacterium]|jgi:ABC-type glutathione transport system ATPase component|nr:ATP-binding cassette domain-containing protein [Acidobacteriaceae bacterium]